ncbi:MAG TPA: DUF6163 family protein [Aurantimonas sp.]
MTIGLAPQDKVRSLTRSLITWLCRVSAIAMFVAGVGYWIRLVGIEAGPLARFDLMPIWWKLTAPTLAVLYPVAGIGLWMTVGWGSVVWILIAMLEAVMYLGFPELFGSGLLRLAFHASGLSLLGILRFLAWRERRLARGY